MVVGVSVVVVVVVVVGGGGGRGGRGGWRRCGGGDGSSGGSSLLHAVRLLCQFSAGLCYGDPSHVRLEQGMRL